jgi:hypothetical protein
MYPNGEAVAAMLQVKWNNIGSKSESSFEFLDKLSDISGP